MPTISRAYINAFSRQIDALSEAARQTLASRLADVDVDDYDEVASVMRFVCGPYTNMSAALTAQFYDGIRASANATGKYKAQAISGYDPERLTAAAIAVAEESASGNGTVPLPSLLGDVVDREINNASRECVRQNAHRDPAKPKYASVPTGSNPCAWCVMRASAGFIYSEDSGSHNNCHCRLVPGFNGSSKVEGYDQKSYEREYDDASEAYRRGDIPDELKERISAAREKHRQDYAEGKVSKQWDSSNAILMVMREQKK